MCTEGSEDPTHTAQQHQCTHTGVLSLVGVRHKAIECPHLLSGHSTLSRVPPMRTDRCIPATQTPCIPISHVTSQLSLFLWKQRSRPSVRTTSSRHHLKGGHTATADPRVVNCNRLGHQQVIHTLQQHEHKVTYRQCPIYLSQLHQAFKTALTQLLTRQIQSRSSTTR